MEKRSILMVMVLFVLIVVGMFVFAYLKNGEIKDVQQEVPQVEEPSVVDEGVSPYDSITRIDAKHFYIDGIHTLAGAVVMPTPCDLVETDAIVAESFPEQVTINFTVINNAETCAQVLSEQRFKVSVTASEEATFKATFQGRPVELNLFDALPGETPDEFELFLKG